MLLCPLEVGRRTEVEQNTVLVLVTESQRTVVTVDCRVHLAPVCASLVRSQALEREGGRVHFVIIQKIVGQ